MPWSLSGRCHRTSSLETFLLTSAPWWSCIVNANSLLLKKSSKTSGPETSQHLLAANKTPFPSHGGEKWSRKSDLQETAGALKPEDEKEKWGQPDSRHWQLGYPPNAWATPILVAMVMYSTPPPSTLDQISLSWHAAGRNAFNSYSPVGDTATATEESEVQDEAISLWTHETQKLCLYFLCNEYCLFRSYTT